MSERGVFKEQIFETHLKFYISYTDGEQRTAQAASQKKTRDKGNYKLAELDRNGPCPHKETFHYLSTVMHFNDYF